MRYLPYELTADIPNVVVDGSPNASTRLALTHWPGIAQPNGLGDDLSAQMAFRFVESGQVVDADVVTNNHFDQDGLVAMFALIDPERALRHRELLIDVAAAGDFATYRHRSAARTSMAIARIANPSRSPLASRLTGPYEEQCAVLYPALLDELVPMVTEPERFTELWEDEDAVLAAGESALVAGRISISEHRDLDVAIIDVGADAGGVGGHRFAGGDTYDGVHPMAINNATDCFRLLQIEGQRYVYTDRYETWVQYRSRCPLRRVDLRPLADELTSLDTSTTWSATAPSGLTPTLRSADESSLDRSTVIETVERHLQRAPSAWDPFPT